MHCPNCGRRLAELRGAITLRCRRCGAKITAETQESYITVQVCVAPGT